jgi:hypothetical protein
MQKGVLGSDLVSDTSSSEIVPNSFSLTFLWGFLPMAKIQVSQPIDTNNEQSLYSETSMLYTEFPSTETEKFPEPEFDIKPFSSLESDIQAPSKQEQTPAPKSSVAVSQRRTTVVRRCGGLSEF